MKHLVIALGIVFLLGCRTTAQTRGAALENPPAHEPPYPARWWNPVPCQGAPLWEILPQEAGYGEVILSKRNELGLLSNFAPTPFVFHGKKYASVEGFWQATKFPEGPDDPRTRFPGVVWTHSRDEVAGMTGFSAKDAGNSGSDNMKKMDIDWVTFEGRKLVYKEAGESPFYQLILQVMTAKLEQNPQVRKVLMDTEGLKLRPDHHDSEGGSLKAWRYYDIWMKLRSD